MRMGMNKKNLSKIKQNLKNHIDECREILSSIEKKDSTNEQKFTLKKITDLIKYKNAQTLTSLGENKKFIELMDSIPSVAIQGYNKKREVIYWNKASEKIYGYSSSEAFGEKLENLIIPKEMREIVVGHITDWYENGNAIPAGELMLQRKDKTTAHVFSSHVMLGEGTSYTEMFCVDIYLSEIALLRVENQALEEKANFDKLTNLYNRHYFESIIDQKMRNAINKKKELSLIMFDIDFFKKINDKYGHDVGDNSLIALTEIIKETIRNDDIAVRWGGEEFMVLIETNLSQANIIANKLRENIALKTTNLDNIPYFTCSFGVVDILTYNSFQKAYKSVDEKLYFAKNNGRNRVES